MTTKKDDLNGLENAICYNCGEKIIRTYTNPDDPQEEIYVCKNNHYEHSVKFKGES